jgi:leucyl-tRNA synthetase
MQDFTPRNRAQPFQLRRAREMRNNPTRAEGILWSELRGKQLKGHKFRRQSPVGDYIADFVCLGRRLIIEVDGVQHAEAKQARHDRMRTIFLRGENFRVLRFWNDEVLADLPMVLATIAHALENSEHEHTGERPAPDRTPSP